MADDLLNLVSEAFPSYRRLQTKNSGVSIGLQKPTSVEPKLTVRQAAQIQISVPVQDRRKAEERPERKQRERETQKERNGERE